MSETSQGARWRASAGSQWAGLADIVRGVQRRNWKGGGHSSHYNYFSVAAGPVFGQYLTITIYVLSTQA